MAHLELETVTEEELFMVLLQGILFSPPQTTIHSLLVLAVQAKLQGDTELLEINLKDVPACPACLMRALKHCLGENPKLDDLYRAAEQELGLKRIITMH